MSFSVCMPFDKTLLFTIPFGIMTGFSDEKPHKKYKKGLILFLSVPFEYINRFTMDNYPVSVCNMARSSLFSVSIITMKGLTVERSLMYVSSMGKHFIL